MHRLMQEGFIMKVLIALLVVLIILVSCLPLKTAGLEAVKECVSIVVVQGVDREAFEKCIVNSGVKIGDNLLAELKRHLLENYDSNALTKILSKLFGITSPIGAEWGDDENKANIIVEAIRIIDASRSED